MFWWSCGKSLAFSVLWWSRGKSLAFPVVWWFYGKSLALSAANLSPFPWSGGPTVNLSRFPWSGGVAVNRSRFPWSGGPFRWLLVAPWWCKLFSGVAGALSFPPGACWSSSRASWALPGVILGLPEFILDLLGLILGSFWPLFCFVFGAVHKAAEAKNTVKFNAKSTYC